MRVALLSANARRHNAIGNQIAEKVRFFQERGAEVRVFVQDARSLHSDLDTCSVEIAEPAIDGPAWNYLRNADLVIAVYAQYFDLLQYLPKLAGTGPRIVFDYLGITPLALWGDQQREGIEQSARQRGYVWCADHALTTSQANRRELVEATHFAREHIATIPLVVNTDRFHPGLGASYWQKRLGIDGRILLYVGRVAPNKRVPLLVETLAHLRDCHAVIVGDCSDAYAEEAARCLGLAQELGVADRVHFVGPLDDAELPRAYRGADVLVMPSLHEGFCVPVLEAMACGLPVVASRSTALPETVGDAGLTFTSNDLDDLVRQLQRVLNRPVGSVHAGRVGIDTMAGCAVNDNEPRPLGSGRQRTRSLTDAAREIGSADVGNPMRKRGIGAPRRVAVVSFRFGPDIVGGAETSLRTMAKALQEAGHHVEVFATCTTSESNWQNDVPAATVVLDGLTVHRFPIDPHDAIGHGETVRAILEADGNVSRDVVTTYLARSVHSRHLIEELRRRRDEFDAIITGPYLFGLTADVVREFGGKVVLVPCFHDEPLARLTCWPQMYSTAGGILFHSPEEQLYAQCELGVNHPKASQIGTRLTLVEAKSPPPIARPYIVYCGRYSAQKNVPLLVEWARRYREEGGTFEFLFVGRGEVALPRESWLHDLGHVDEKTKHAALAGARALVQLSTHESLSIVALEAWAVGTPVIVHEDCAVLTGQVQRSQGGVVVRDYAEFADALRDLKQQEAAWQQRGANGRAYVEERYANARDYVDRLVSAIDRMGLPVAEQMRQRGLERAGEFRRELWQQRFAEFIEHILTQPGRPIRAGLTIEPMRAEFRAVVGTRTLLLPVHLTNRGTHAAVPDGLGRTVLCGEVRALGSSEPGAREEVRLPALLMPGQSHAAAVPITLPAQAGSYRIGLWTEGPNGDAANMVELSLTVDATGGTKSCAATFLDTVQETLPRAHQLQQLPADYVDVTEGTLAPAKRWLKRKLLGNFKHAYVDVLSRQQSQVNGQVVLMIQQLAECCAMLDHAVAGLHQRLDTLEAKLEGLSNAEREAQARDAIIDA